MFVEKGKEKFVCTLKKSLYGLKHASKKWYKKVDCLIVRAGFVRGDFDHRCCV